MRPDVLELETESNFAGESFAFGIDETARAHIIKQLTDLYSDRILAFVREYMTNAWDSHVEAGITRPIEVTTPSRWGGDFVVQDFGTGLSLDDLRKVYSKYGASTKRETNTANGMLGFGCKAALTYGNSFTVRSVKDGLAITAAVVKNDEGIGEVSIVDTKSTDEANGVKITIPVKGVDRHTVKDRVDNFVRGWKSGTVLVNGEPNKHVSEEKGYHFTSGSVFPAPGYEHKMFATMGNVTYPVESRFASIFPGRTITYLYFEIGELNFAPPRESLSYTPKTEKALEAKIEALRAEVETFVEAEVAGSDCCLQGYIRATKNYALFRRGGTVPADKFTNLKHGPYGGVYQETRYSSTYLDYDDRVRCNKDNSNLGYLDEVAVVEGFPNDRPSRAQHFKAKAYFGEIKSVVWATDPLHPELICDKHRDKVTDWETIKKVKTTVPAAPRTTVVPRTLDEYQVIDGDTGYKHATTTVDTNKDITYVHAADSRIDLFREEFNGKVPPGAALYRVRKPDLDRFLAAYPSAKHFTAYAQEFAKGLAKPADVVYDVLDAQRLVESMKPFRSRILDPHLVSMIDNLDVAKEFEAKYRVVTSMGAYPPFSLRRDTYSTTSIAKNYPLLGRYASLDEHSLIYVNAIYKHKKDNE